MFVYIITNPGKSVLYTGVTNNLKRRLSEHKKNRGNPKTFAGKFYCYQLLYYEEISSPMEAIKREKEIKKLSRVNKFKLVETKNPYFKFYRL